MDLSGAAELMNRLIEVRWDRCMVSEGRGSAFGWISRPDGRADFALLLWDGEGMGFATSSAQHSRQFSERIFGSAKGHRDCQRVEDVFGALVANKLALEKGPGCDPA